MRKAIIAMIALGAATAVHAQDVSGSARASDGDRLNMTGIVIRLHGIDAPEFKQTCNRDGSPWGCGEEAADRLTALVEGKDVRCEYRDTDDGLGCFTERAPPYSREFAAGMLGYVFSPTSSWIAALAASLSTENAAMRSAEMQRPCGNPVLISDHTRDTLNLGPVTVLHSILDFGADAG